MPRPRTLKDAFEAIDAVEALFLQNRTSLEALYSDTSSTQKDLAGVVRETDHLATRLQWLEDRFKMRLEEAVIERMTIERDALRMMLARQVYPQHGCEMPIDTLKRIIEERDRYRGELRKLKGLPDEL